MNDYHVPITAQDEVTAQDAGEHISEKHMQKTADFIKYTCSAFQTRNKMAVESFICLFKGYVLLQ